MFSVDVFVKIWKVTDKGNYAEVECSTSKKNRDTGKYEVDFSSKYVRFVGSAYAKRPRDGERVKITSCGVQNVFEKDGQKQYMKNPSFVIFDFEREGGSDSNAYVPSEYSSFNSNGFEDFGAGEGENLPF